jgi:hypothetical protein
MQTIHINANTLNGIYCDKSKAIVHSLFAVDEQWIGTMCQHSQQQNATQLKTIVNNRITFECDRLAPIYNNV